MAEYTNTETFRTACEAVESAAELVYIATDEFLPGVSAKALLTQIAALATACVTLERTLVAWSRPAHQRWAAGALRAAESDLSYAARRLAAPEWRIASGPAHATCILALLQVGRLLPVVLDREDDVLAEAA